MSAVIPLDELLILSSLDDRKLYLLSPEARCQCCLYIPTFCWQTKRHVASPPPPNVTMTFFGKNSLETPPYNSLHFVVSVCLIKTTEWPLPPTRRCHQVSPIEKLRRTTDSVTIESLFSYNTYPAPCGDVIECNVRIARADRCRTET